MSFPNSPQIRALLTQKANLLARAITASGAERETIEGVMREIDGEIDGLRRRLIARQSVSVTPILRVA